MVFVSKGEGDGFVNFPSVYFWALQSIAAFVNHLQHKNAAKLCLTEAVGYEVFSFPNWLAADA